MFRPISAPPQVYARGEPCPAVPSHTVTDSPRRLSQPGLCSTMLFQICLTPSSNKTATGITYSLTGQDGALELTTVALQDGHFTYDFAGAATVVTFLRGCEVTK